MSEYLCPHCKNPIYDDEAILCLFCGGSLNRPGKRFPKSKMIFLVIAAIALFSFIIYLIK
jgi:predicted nucleic acid-binding Zn ribbon protein